MVARAWDTTVEQMAAQIMARLTAAPARVTMAAPTAEPMAALTAEPMAALTVEPMAALMVALTVEPTAPHSP